MSDVDAALYLDSRSVRCRISNLSIKQADHQGQEDIEHIVMGDRPFRVQLTVEFLGNAAIALLMLEPVLSVELLAKPIGIGDTVELGEINQLLTPTERLYSPVIEIESPNHHALLAGLYHLIAVIRVGAEDGPALLCGSLEGGLFEVYLTPPEDAATPARKPARQRQSKKSKSKGQRYHRSD